MRGLKGPRSSFEATYVGVPNEFLGGGNAGCPSRLRKGSYFFAQKEKEEESFRMNRRRSRDSDNVHCSFLPFIIPSLSRIFDSSCNLCLSYQDLKIVEVT